MTRTVELRLDGFRYFYRVYPHAASYLDPIVVLTGAFQSLDAWKRLAWHPRRWDIRTT